MSGFLGAAASLIGFLDGGGTVQVGPVTLSGFSCPESIPFGGGQMLTVHKLPGGTRIIDAMGPDAVNPQWQGLMLGPTALSDARALDQACQAGNVVPLSWDDFDHDAVILNFRADYRRSTWMGSYQLELVILTSYPADTSPTLLGSITSDISDALGVDVAGLVPQVTQGIAAVQSVLPAFGALIPGSGIVASISSGLAQAQGLASAASLLGNTQVGSFGGITSAPSSLSGIVSSAGSLAAATGIGGFLSHAASSVEALV